MANPDRGDASLEVGGKTYTLRFTVEAMIAAETQASTPQRMVTFAEIGQRVERGSIASARLLLWAALQDRHPETELADASRLMDEAGYVRASQAVGQALERLMEDRDRPSRRPTLRPVRGRRSSKSASG